MGGITKTITGLIGGGGGDPAPIIAPAPVVQPVTPMPEPDDTATQRARRRSAAAQRMRSGRESTILSDTTDTLG